MVYLIILLVMSFLTGILTYFVVKGKINVYGHFIAYTTITFLPIFLTGFPLLFFLSLLGKYREYFIFIPVTIIGLEIMILLVCIIIKINICPCPALSRNENEDKKLLRIGYSIRLLNYSIFAGLLYFIPTLVASVLSICFGLLGIGSVIASIAIIVSFAFLFTIPYAILSFIAGAIAVILCIFVIVVSVNGVVRLSYECKVVRKNIIKNIIFMFLPIFNIVCMFRLYSLAKKELSIRHQY